MRRILKYVVGLPLIALATSCSGLGEKEAELFESARTASAASQWQEVLDRLNPVLEAEPDYTPARRLRAQANFELRQFEAAFSDLELCVASGELTEEEGIEADLVRGRCLLEQARQLEPDLRFWDSRLSPDARKKARDLFLKANLILAPVAQAQPSSYDAQLWRSYAVLRLENYRKALDLLELCEGLAPGRWEHKYFKAMALDGLYRVNAQSLETLFSIAASGPRSELEPVYQYLVSLAPDVTPEVSARIFKAVSEYAKAVPQPSQEIVSFVAEARARQETERRKSRFAELERRVQDLSERERYAEAVQAIEALAKEQGESAESSRLLRETQERWSMLLEARTETLIGSRERDKLESALKNLEQSRSMTGKVDRLVALQQKINAVQIALAKHETSRRLHKIHESLKGGKHTEVLQDLAAVNLEGLSEQDRDLYHYLRGVASFHLGQWTSAAKAFSSMNQRSYDNLDALHGLALVRSGQENAGIPMLTNLKPEERNDEVNRILGLHCVERGELQNAVGYLAALKSPTPSDLQAHLRSRRELGLEYYRKSDYRHAAEELQAARQILEVQLHQRATDVYLHLGHCYFHLEEYERAKRVYKDLSESNLTEAERIQCRDLHLNRARILLGEKSSEQAYRDFAEFVRLGGQLPPDATDVYGRLVATYADYVPLARVQYWNYTSTARDYNSTLFVRGDRGGTYSVERKEGGAVSEETWSHDGVFLVRKVGEALVKLPVKLNPADETLPSIQYTSQGQDCTAEIVAIQQAVELPGGKRYTDCIKVRLWRTQKQADGTIQSTRQIFYFAPGVGEVKQELYRNDKRVSEIVLSDFALRSPQLGN